jgi:branched-chain amino acid transport system substrate-binding protein
VNLLSKLWRSVGVLSLVVGASAFISVGTQASAGASAGGAPITVGVVCTCSGPFGGDVLAAADVYKSWVNATNATGGINGHKIQLTLKDDAGNPGTSASAAQALISAHVDAIVDLSIVDQTWAATVQASGIPVVGADETETPFYQFSDFFSEGQTNDSVTVANVLTAKTAGATNLGDLYCAEAPSCQEGVPLIEAAGQKLKVPVIYNGEISATAPNYTAQCVAAQQAKVSAVFIGDAAFVIQKVAQDCAQQSYKPIYITEGEGFALNLASTAGLSTKLWSDYGTVPFFAKIPAIKAMNKAVDKYYPGLRNNTTAWSQIAAEGWASGLLLHDAVVGSGLSAKATPTPAAIVKGLYSLKGDTLGGMAPPLTFKKGQPHKIDCWFTARVKNGVPALVNGGRVTCENGS